MLKRTRTKTMVLTCCLLMLSSVSAFAASYNFTFTPPFAGSAKSSSLVTADGKFTAYVDPGGTTNATTYVLTRGTSQAATVSNFRTDVTSARSNFTYDTGYGGAGQKYKLTGYPSNHNFQAYKAAGTWKP